MFDERLQRIRCEYDDKIAGVEYRAECAARDHDDKLAAILGHLGLKLEKVSPEATPYRVVALRK